MKEKYIRTYGNAYSVPSPNDKQLMELFKTTCEKSGILYKPGECFKYMAELPERYEQLSLF